MAIIGYKFISLSVLGLAAWYSGILDRYYYYYSDRFDPNAVDGMRVLITGCSSGIGEQLAYEYAKLGAEIVVTARRGSLLIDVVRRCKELGAKKVDYVTADMSEPADRRSLVEKTVRLLGGLDQLILNHARVAAGQFSGTQTDVQLLRDMIEVNVISYADLAWRFAPHLTSSSRGGGGGNVGVVSSVSGKIGFATMAHYSSTKFALQGFFGPLRHELRLGGAGVSVTMAILGSIDTETTRMHARHVYPGIERDKMIYQTPAPVEEAARAIIRGVTMRADEIVYPANVFWLLALHKFVPQLIEDHVSAGLFKAMTTAES